MTVLVRAAFFEQRKTVSVALLLMGALVFAYAPVLQTLVGQWWSNNMYSHGFVVPLISLYLVWLRRERLAQLAPIPSYAGGGAVLFAGIGMLVLGRVGSVLSLQELSLLVTIAGGVLFLLGTRSFRILWVPLAYLSFMIPLWEILTDRLHLPFQLFSSSIGVTFLQAIGIPAYREGIFIELPNIVLEIAKVCSGVNYLIAVVAIGIPLAYVFLQGWVRRILLVGLAVSIAVLTNGLRVGLIGTLSYYQMAADLHGPFHTLQGVLVSFVGYAALFGGAWALGGTAPSADTSARPRARLLAFRPVAGTGAIRPPVVALSLLFLLTGTYLYLHRTFPVPPKKDLKDFPAEIGPWRGADSVATQFPYRELGPDMELSRTYRTTSGDSVRLYIAYFAQQQQGKELIHYKVKHLHANASTIRLELAPPEGSIQVNTLIRGEQTDYRLILFWYDLNGRITTDRYLAKAYTIWDGVTRGTSNGAVIMLTSEFAREEDLPRMISISNAFIGELFPLLRQHLP